MSLTKVSIFYVKSYSYLMDPTPYTSLFHTILYFPFYCFYSIECFFFLNTSNIVITVFYEVPWRHLVYLALDDAQNTDKKKNTQDQFYSIKLWWYHKKIETTFCYFSFIIKFYYFFHCENVWKKIAYFWQSILSIFLGKIMHKLI